MFTSHSSVVKVFDMRAKNLTRAKLSRDLNHCANFIKISYADKSARRIGPPSTFVENGDNRSFITV